MKLDKCLYCGDEIPEYYAEKICDPCLEVAMEFDR